MARRRLDTCLRWAPSAGPRIRSRSRPERQEQCSPQLRPTAPTTSGCGRSMSGTSATSNEFTLRVGCTAPPPPPTALKVQFTASVVTLMWLPPTGSQERQLIEAGSGPGLTNIASLTLPATQAAFTASAPQWSVPMCEPGPRTAAARAHPQVRFSSLWVRACRSPAHRLGLWPMSRAGTSRFPGWRQPAQSPGYLLGPTVVPKGSRSRRIPLGPTTVFAANNAPLGTFYMRVRAVNAAGVGPPTADAMVVVP